MVKAYHHSTDYAFPYCEWALKLVYEGRCDIEFHNNLPQPYLDKPRLVFWCGPELGRQLYGEDGTGDDQLYIIYPKISPDSEQSRAVSMQRITLYFDLI